jgi:hypothetical protein
LLSYLLAFLLACFLTCLLSYLLAFLLACFLTCLLSCFVTLQDETLVAFKQTSSIDDVKALVAEASKPVGIDDHTEVL